MKPITADQVKAKPIEFLWNGRIPKGMISVVAGQPDKGKGLFAAHVAAEVSKTAKVLYSAAEDDAARMTVPRLQAAGANLENIILWRFALPANGVELAELVKIHDVDLIVMDPFASHLSNGVSRHSDKVRQVLDPLNTLAEQHNTAVLIVEHALKRVPANSSPLAAIGGSGSGLPAASRAAYVFGIDPDDEDSRVLAPAKFNIGQTPKALSFEIDVVDNDIAGEVPALLKSGELEVFDPMRLFTLTDPKDGDAAIGRPADKREAAAEWLTVYLAQAGAPVKAGQVQDDAKQNGMSVKTLRRAADEMGVVKHPAAGGKNCTWDLPDDVKTMMGLNVTPATPADEPKADEPAGSVDDLIGDILGGGDNA